MYHNPAHGPGLFLRQHIFFAQGYCGDCPTAVLCKQTGRIWTPKEQKHGAVAAPVERTCCVLSKPLLSTDTTCTAHQDRPVDKACQWTSQHLTASTPELSAMTAELHTTKIQLTCPTFEWEQSQSNRQASICCQLRPITNSSLSWHVDPAKIHSQTITGNNSRLSTIDMGFG